MSDIIKLISDELSVKYSYVQNVVQLLDEGNTLPFIARYRKEQHGALNDTALRLLYDRLIFYRNLDLRRAEIIKLIDAQGLLTEDILNAINNSSTISSLDDIYRPFRPKRRTRASIARDNGLEPFAIELFSQSPNSSDIKITAQNFITRSNSDLSIESALQGAADIISEMISDCAENRHLIKNFIHNKGSIDSIANTPDIDSVYSLYYQFSQPFSKIQSHQILALNRGEKEGFLKISLSFDHDAALILLCEKLIRHDSVNAVFLESVVKDSLERLMIPSLENGMRKEITASAFEGAIKNFAANLKPLLMQPPVKGKVTMGLDPGYRNGCKTAVVDPTGKVLATAVVYPTHSEKKEEDAISLLTELILKFKIERIAIGNGTASRETERMVVKLLKHFPGVGYMVVNEAGASVYSVSELASKEFPDFDVNLRSAISIARRLQDPLAELVKIDPKSIGVGQYQHDMPESKLNESLAAVVEDCVNTIGADLNTASVSLLEHISGLSASTAKNIVAFRETNGPFVDRKQLLKVPKLGPKTFEQCAGFLRISESKNVFDNSGVHPESYKAAEKLLTLFGYTDNDVKCRKLGDLPRKIHTYGEKNAAKYCEIDVFTLADIAKELTLPGRDPRDELPPPIFRTDLLDLKDIKQGMVLTGTVRNVIDFGAFVDIGVHQDGLVHISEICDRYIKHPSEVLSIGQDIRVIVIGVDEKKKRISLSMKIDKYSGQ